LRHKEDSPGRDRIFCGDVEEELSSRAPEFISLSPNTVCVGSESLARVGFQRCDYNGLNS
jgi:hypothetical protein